MPIDPTMASLTYSVITAKLFFWYGERVGGLRGSQNIIYNGYCKGGKIYIPPFKSRPEPLASLASFDGNTTSKKIMKSIRQYNYMFAFTSIGAHIDNSLNDGRGPPIFKICGHRIGSLLPPEDGPPKFI
jgi:hypothetical protein